MQYQFFVAQQLFKQPYVCVSVLANGVVFKKFYFDFTMIHLLIACLLTLTEDDYKRMPTSHLIRSVGEILVGSHAVKVSEQMTKVIGGRDICW